MTRFVIVVDTQWDFMAAEGALSVAGAEPLIGPMRDWLAGLSPKDTAGVLFTFDTHVPEVYAGSPESEQFPIHCIQGTTGWANVLDVGLLDPAIPGWWLEKGVFDMWAQDGLEIGDARAPDAPRIDRDTFFDVLKAKGVTDVAVIGVAADFCVKWAIEGLVKRGFDVTIPAGLTRGIVREMPQVAADDFAGASLVVEPA